MPALRSPSRVWVALLPALLLAGLAPAADVPRTLQVGPERAITRLSHAAQVARDGDTVEVDAGTYASDYASWPQNNLTIRGVGGMAHLAAGGLIPNGKGIWVIQGDNVVIENIEFSGARVRHTNGAGIRHEGGNLTLRNTLFHHNEFSVLSGYNPAAKIEVRNSRFWHQRRETRWSHGIYIGSAGRLTLEGNHFLGTDTGHHVKSRAFENHIRYNRIEDVPGGNASRLVDLPNCGLSYVVGNELHQGPGARNLDIVGYGMEGCDGRSEEQQRLFVTHNTLVNEARSATLVATASGGTALVMNNLVYGNAQVLRGAGQAAGNLLLALPAGQARWREAPPAQARGAALPLPKGATEAAPDAVFTSPSGTKLRRGRADIGARETEAASNEPPG
jgi:hypothetical protein